MLENLVIFAQQEMPDFPTELDAGAAAVGAGLMIAMVIGLIIGLAIAILLLYLVYSCFAR